MGLEIEVNSLEDMCLLMCDNVIPKKKPRGGTQSPQGLPIQPPEKGSYNYITTKTKSKGREG